MASVEVLVAIAVAKMVAQKIADYSLAPLKVYCCSLFCTFRDDLKELEKELLCLEAHLKEKDKWLFGIEVSDDGQAVLAQSWHRDAKQLAFEIEDIIDEFVCSEELYHGSTCAHKASLFCSYSNPIAVRFCTVKKMISEIKKLNLAINMNERYGAGPSSHHLESRNCAEKETTSYDGPDAIIGRANDLEAILHIIKEEEKRLFIIAIVGPVGIGKTCLAQLVFNHPDKGNRFSCRIWVYVNKSSPKVDIKRIGRQVISQGILPGEERPSSDYTMQEITNKVHEILKRERCLVVLDGLWGAEADVDSLKQMFTSFCGKTESVIVVTTHSEQVAQQMSTLPLYRLAPMVEGDYCLDIFASALRGRNSLLHRYGKQIISRCEGIPLVADFLGSVIRNGGWDQHDVWENARVKDLWKLEEDYSTTLNKELTLFNPFRLMFYNMPHGLRLCFAYCSVFPKGSCINKRKLIQQWISLNMVEPAIHGSVTVEMNAENIIEQLKAIHLLQVEDNVEGSPPSTGEALRMHYMAYELARFISNKDILVVPDDEDPGNAFPQEKDETSSIYCCSQEKKQATLTYCDHRYAQIPLYTKNRPQKARSLILRPRSNLQEPEYVNNLISICEVISVNKYLRVLDLSGCGITEMPACVYQLKQLRYLDASNLDIKHLPCVHNCLRKIIYLNLQACRSLQHVHESFGKLSSLEYLNLSQCVALTELPASFKRLRSKGRKCKIELSGCQDCVVEQFNSELKSLADQASFPEFDQCPQKDNDPNSGIRKCQGVSFVVNEMMEGHSGLSSASTFPVDITVEHEKSQPTLEKNRGTYSSFSSSKATTVGISHYEATVGVPCKVLPALPLQVHLFFHMKLNRDTAGAAGPSTSSRSCPAESVREHAISSVEFRPCEGSVQS